MVFACSFGFLSLHLVFVTLRVFFIRFFVYVSVNIIPWISDILWLQVIGDSIPQRASIIYLRNWYDTAVHNILHLVALVYFSHRDTFLLPDLFCHHRY